MKISRWVHLFLAVMIIAGCKPARLEPATPDTLPPAEVSTLTPTETARPSAPLSFTPSPFPTASPPPTETPIPPTVTPTTVPTVTPPPPLARQGPHLLIWMDEETFMLLDADGRGRRLVKLPAGNIGDRMGNWYRVSPDGQWLAYNTGEIGKTGITLNLMNISDGSIMPVAIVLPAHYETGIPVVAQALPALFPKLYPPETDTMGLVEASWTDSIGALEWSPDGRYLAFAAQIDGPSFDVYLYNLQTHGLVRLEDDLLNVSSILWSPDGQRILYRNLLPGEFYEGRSWQVLRMSRPTVKNPPELLSGNFWSFLGWAGSKFCLVYVVGDGARGWIQLLNLDTGQKTKVWPYTLESYAYDDEHQQLLISHIPYGNEENGPGEGLYLVKLNGSYHKISEKTMFSPAFWGRAEAPYLASDLQNYYALDRDGTQALISERNGEVAVSPDGQWAAAYNDFGVDLVGLDGRLVTKVEIRAIHSIIWRPDSQGLFFITQDRKFFYLGINSSAPALIEDCRVANCRFGAYSWLP